MTASHTAHGLASLGRHGDSVLVHMSPQEVHGLQSLAKAHGTSLTINPHTGMPEAFSLGGLFKAALPMIAGFALGPGGFGLGESIFGTGSFMGSALGSGLLVGGLTGLMTGNLGQGLMAGLGAYGGYGLSDTLSKLGTTAPITTEATTKAIENSTGANLIGGNEVGMFNKFPGTVSGTSPFSDVGVSNIPASGGQVGMANSFPSTMGGSGPINPTSMFNTSGLSRSWEGLKSLGQEGGWDRAKAILGTPGKEAAITGVTRDSAGNIISTTSTPATAGTPLTNMQLAGKFAPSVSTLALGAFGNDLTAQNPAVKDRQKRIRTGTDSNGNPIYTYMPETAYSPDETLNLDNPLQNYPDRKPAPALVLPPTVIAKEGGIVQGYAGGGSVAGIPTPFNSGVSDQYNIPDGTQAQNTPSSPYGLGRLNTLSSQQTLENAKTLGYSEGGETHLNLDELPTLNVNTGEQSYNTIQSALANSNNPQGRLLNRLFSTFKDSQGRNIYDQFAAQGLKRLNNSQMAKGGYLDGEGDGMSDSIPATIEGKQPARLADGEFVIPADVVSHLGNGSSKAGSKRLYAMLDKVRKARTGHTKQGKQINPNKFLPA